MATSTCVYGRIDGEQSGGGHGQERVAGWAVATAGSQACSDIATAGPPSLIGPPCAGLEGSAYDSGVSVDTLINPLRHFWRQLLRLIARQPLSARLLLLLAGLVWLVPARAVLPEGVRAALARAQIDADSTYVWVAPVGSDTPRLAHQALNENRLAQLEAGLTLMLRQQQSRNQWLGVIAGLLAVTAAATLYLAFQ